MFYYVSGGEGQSDPNCSDWRKTPASSIAYGLSHEPLDLKIGKDGPSIDDYLVGRSMLCTLR
jgi:hypothetical protein